MIEKTFQDMLQLNNGLTGGQREFLEDGGYQDCDNCIIGSLCDDNCAKVVGLKPGIDMCEDIMKEVLRLDSEYKKECTEKGILSQGAFIKYLSYVCREGDAGPSAIDLKNSHAAALKYISQLENKIDDLEARLADSAPAQVDTPEVAELTAREKVADFLRRGVDFEFRNDLFHKKYIVNERLQEPDGGSPEYFEFPYAEPVAPLSGDLVVSKMVNPDNGTFCGGVLKYQYGETLYLTGSDEETLSIDDVLPITHRVDENGRIVPISADRG